MEKSTEQLINELKEEVFYLKYDVEYLSTEEERAKARESLAHKLAHLDQLRQTLEDEWE